MKKIFVIISALVILSGCATIIHGSKEDIGISSSPTNASVTIDNKAMGKTPLSVKLTRKDLHVIKINMDGYKPYELQVSRKVSGWIAGNVIFGGLIGLAVDAIDGALYQLSPDNVNAMLSHSGMSARVTKNRIFITFVMHPDKGWKKIGNLKAD